MGQISKKSLGAFFAGVLTVNSLGHLATAAAGKEQLTPLAGRHSGPAVNALWGVLNLGGGLVIARKSRTPGVRWGREIHAFDAGAATCAAWMALSEPVFRFNTTSKDFKG